MSEEVLAAIWHALGGDAADTARVTFTGPAETLPGPFSVDAFAAGTIAAATLAVSELVPDGFGVTVDRRHAALAFRSESHVRPLGWRPPPIWDAIAGDYPTDGGWIRLHTNYEHHRHAALKALGLPGDADRDSVAAAVATWDAEALEAAVVAAGGCAAATRPPEEWRTHPQGVAVASEPLVAITRRGPGRTPPAPGRGLPLHGVRILDLTRVIAGPVASRFLAGYGADVLRIDPPGFAEMAGLLVETTAGKRRAALDLTRRTGRDTFDALLAGAHAVIHGYRPGALAALGLDDERLRAHQPALVIAGLDAYGWTGPWRGRRGFDSLVQHSTGITTIGRHVRAADRPVPLPAQALDHGTGYLLAAAVARALTSGGGATLHASLARTAAFLMALPAAGDPARPLPSAADAAPYAERTATAWGPVERLRPAGRIGSVVPTWTLPPGPLGDGVPTWN